MNFKRVAIIGVGLIGGSFALSLKKLGFNGKIIGVGRKKENLIKAKKLRIIDEYSTVPAKGVKDTDLILLSTPVGQFQKIVEKIRKHIKKGAIVTDVGSVKAEVVKKLEPLMPEGVSFVGGHPIAGKECSGVSAASSELFNNIRCIITPSPNTDRKALKKILDLWRAVGSKTVLMTPDEHDSIFASVSHLPHVVAYALINAIMDLNKNILPHGGRGLRDMTRIALSPPELWRDVCSYNRENILKSLNQFLTSITHVKKLIKNSEWDSLEKEFKRAKTGQTRLIRCGEKANGESPKAMNQINIKYKKTLNGEITPPPDKSISHRAVIISSLSEGKSIIRNFLYAEDPMKTITAFRQMGIEIKDFKSSRVQEFEGSGELVINGKGLRGLTEPENVIDCGNSGTTIRLLCGVLAGQPFSTMLTGDSSLIRRPMQRVITPLTEMGAHIKSEKGGYPPLSIRGGELKPIHYRSLVASAQVKSAILLAGLYCDGVTTVTEPGKSRDHTERMLKAAGANVEIKNLEVSVTGKANLKPLDITIPGDFSSAAFFIVAGTIVPGSKILIKHVGINPTRTGLIDILKIMGADIRFENKREISGEPVADIYIKHSELTGTEISGDMALRSIDEFPILCVVASVARRITKISGAKELRVKESDRIASMAKELRKMGVRVEELEDGIIINGRERLNAATVQSYGDHRVAMALAVAGLMADGETIIEDTACIETSFPGFMGMLNKLMG